MSFYLQLHLLGPVQIILLADKEPKLGRKTRAILAYLAAADRAHSRRHLMELFCREAADPAGALRWHLSRIRRQLAGDVLQIAGQEIAVNRQVANSDHLAFQRVMTHPAGQTTADLHHAFTLYRGEFLADIDLRDAPQFDQWLLGERARYRRLFENGAQVLIGRYIHQQEFAEAIPIARTLLQTNPLLEPVQAQLIWLYAQTGQRDSALRQFSQCRELLWQELAVQPAAELLALHDAVLQNRPLPPLAAAEPADTVAKETTATVPDFVGRSAELDRLQTIWKQGGGIILLDAVAGGGKTRLLAEFGHILADDALQLTGHSYESTRTMPYQPWLQVLESFVAGMKNTALMQIPLHWQQQLSLLLPKLYGQESAAPNQQQLFRAILYLLTELAPSRPALLLLEDLQWADEASLQLFQFVAQQRPRTPAPLLLVGTYRTEEMADNAALGTLLHDLGRDKELQRVTLRPFIASEIEQLLTLLWPKLPAGFRTPHIRDMLLQAAGGNPLFTTEILRELATSAELPERLPIPPSLVELTARRLDQLPASGRQVLECLAVLDRPAHFDLAQQISARTEEETLMALELGLRWRLLQPGGYSQVDFSHELFRTAVLAQLSSVRRAILHRRAANILAQHRADAATLAYHWQQAGDVANEARYAAVAGKEAAALFANEEAIFYFERALAIQQSASIWRELGDVRKRTGLWDEAQTAYAQALELAQNQDDRYELACTNLSLGKLQVARGEYQAAQKRLRRAEEIFRQDRQQAKLAETVNNQATIAYRQGNYKEALTYYETALEIDRSLDDKAGMAVRLGNMGLVYLDQSDLNRAETLLEESLALSRQLQRQDYIANRMGNLGIVASVKGNRDQALLLYRQAIAIDEELGNTQSVARHTANVGVEYYHKKDLPAAVDHFLKALAMEQAMGNLRARARLLGNLGAVYQDVGEFAQAVNVMALALQIDIDAGHRNAVARHSGNMALVYLQQEAWETIAQWIQPAIVLARQLHDFHNLAEYLFTAAQLAFHESRVSKAADLNQECLSLAQQHNRPDIYLAASILMLEIQVQQQALTVNEGIEQLYALRAEWPKSSEQASIFDAIWRLDPLHHKARNRAAELYAEAHAQFPLFLHRQRYQALCGKTLPAPSVSPPPVSLLPPPDLQSLIRQLDRFIAPNNDDNQGTNS